MYNFHFLLILILNVGATSAGGLASIRCKLSLLALLVALERNLTRSLITTLPLRFFAFLRLIFGFGDGIG